MSTVVIAGGGTGGHFFPGMSVAEELAARGVGVAWLGARRGIEASRVPPTGIPLHLLPVSGAVGRGGAAALAATATLVPASLAAARHLLGHDAAAVLAVGGYAALPGALAAGALGVPLVLQEQNAIPGLVTRILAPWAAAIACGFAAAVEHFPSLPARWTGNPVRRPFFAVPTAPTIPPAVAVVGGSQGAAILNRLMPAAFARLAVEGIRPQIVHQAGTRWEDETRRRYAEAGVAATVLGFVEDLPALLARSGLVVARAGAATVSELAAARRAALLVPFAAAAHGHQLANGWAYARTGAAEVVEEHQATPEVLAERLALLLASPERLLERGRAGAALARPEAAAAVADLLLSRAAAAPARNHGREVTA